VILGIKGVKMRDDIYGVIHRTKKNNRVIINTGSELYRELKTLSNTEKNVLNLTLKLMEFETNTIIYNTNTKLQLTTALTIQDKTLYNTISKLVKRGYISKTKLPYEYVVNPTFSYTGCIYIVLQYHKQLEGELNV
jgi:hypothetical protein